MAQAGLLQEIPYATAYSLVLDAHGNPHILYSDGSLMYSFSTEQCGLTKLPSIQMARLLGLLLIDSDGNPQVAYTDGSTVKYANWTGSSWNIQTVDTAQAGELS